MAAGNLLKKETVEAEELAGPGALTCGCRAGRFGWETGDLGLYVHIPYCRRKCHYCDFNTYTYRGDRRVVLDEYIEALCREIGRWAAGPLVEKPVHSIFVGGGTPSLLSGDQLERLMTALRRHYRLGGGIEVTLEANPGSAEKETLRRYRQAGVNRLSIGLQAWQDHLLERLGRIHRVDDFRRTYLAAREAGFDNVSIDLMFGLPGQTADDWMETLERVIALEPEHLSLYGLQIEEGTPFHSWHQAGELPLPGEEMTADMYAAAREILPAGGWRQYEISNFARPNRYSRHNSLYWRNQFYLGFGPGAHGHLPGFRCANVERPRTYAEALERGVLPLAAVDPLSENDAMQETLFMGLRLLDGVSLSEFESRFAVEVTDIFEREVEQLIDQELVTLEGDRLRLTPEAVPIANEVFIHFV